MTRSFIHASVHVLMSNAVVLTKESERSMTLPLYVTIKIWLILELALLLANLSLLSVVAQRGIFVLLLKVSFGMQKFVC